MESRLPFFEEFINEERSFGDYPQGAVKNAQKALDWKEKHPEDTKDAGTAIGWERANQLVNGENLSVTTIKRMKSFFSRHEGNEKISDEYKDEPWKDNGYLMWLAWGGDEAKNWAEQKLKELEED